MRPYIRSLALIAALLGVYVALRPLVATGAGPDRIQVSISNRLTSSRSQMKRSGAGRIDCSG